MTSIVEAYKQQYTQQGMQEGMQQGIQAMAKSMLDRGYAPSEIKTLTRISQEGISQAKASDKPRRETSTKA